MEYAVNPPPTGAVQAFWIEPIEGCFHLSLRRFTFSNKVACPSTSWGHDASVALGESGIDQCPRLYEGRPVHGDVWDHADPRWPPACAACGYVFTPEDEWQFRPEAMYRRVDTGERFPLRDAPIGSIWEAPWYAVIPEWTGPDGRALMAKCPGGCEWHIDSRASNCDSPCINCGQPFHVHHHGSCEPGYKDARPHKCWVRSGEPPELDVGKNGITCGAGAGSIQTSNWHGFLHNGWFRTC